MVLAGAAVATTGVVSVDGDDRSAPYEYRHGDDPLGMDPDRDGLDHGTEVDGATDPLDPDTDGDRLADGRRWLGRRTTARCSRPRTRSTRTSTSRSSTCGTPV